MSKRKFSFFTDERINKLKQIRMKKSSEKKLDWAVTAFNDWRGERLHSFKYDVGIYYCDLMDLKSLEKENLRHSLCYFIPEVTKKKGEGPYPGATLYQMIVAIQKFLNVNKIPWKLIDDPYFSDVKIVLDNVMQERTAMNVGVVKR